MSSVVHYLTYTSSIHWVAACNPNTLRQIYQTSKANNELSGVMGFLLFKNDRFVHYMEGNEMTIANLYFTVSQDLRHRNIQIIDYGILDKNRFHHWYMYCLAPTQLLIGKEVSHLVSKFDTYNWQADDVDLLIKNLVNYTHHYPERLADYDVKVGSYAGQIFKFIIQKYLLYLLVLSVMLSVLLI